MSRTFREKLEERLALYADRPVFLFRENGSADVRNVTAREFYSDVSALGGRLINCGYRKKNIAIYGENSYDWILSYFAITASGNTAVLLDHHLSEEELTGLISFTDCECVLYSGSYQDIASNIAEKTAIPFFEAGSLLEESRGNSADTEAYKTVTVSENDAAEIAFTSGTSGKYKGVILSNRNVLSEAECTPKELNPDGLYLQLLPLYHTFGLLNLLGSFLIGSCCFIENSLRFLFTDTAKYDFALTCAVPALLPIIYEAYRRNGRGGNVTVACGGAMADKAMLAKLADLGVTVYSGYGLTECSSCVAVNINNSGADDVSMYVYGINRITVDAPDENGVGEILISGDNVMLGYYKMPEETEKALTDGILRTGDLGKLDENGRLVIVGRKKNIIALPNGEKVSPEAVEQKVCLIKDVSACMLTLQGGVLVLSVWAPDGDRDAIQSELLKLNRTFPSSRRIAKTVFAEAPFAVNSLGKIIRKDNR